MSIVLTPQSDWQIRFSPAQQRHLLRWIIIGICVRLLISAISIGSNDAITWKAIAISVSQFGFFETYRSPAMNHPPLPVLWSSVALLVGGENWFSFVFKLPMILADVLACWMVGKIWPASSDPRSARLAIVTMALNPVAILISAYHGNTDSLYAFLSLLCAYFIAGQRSFFLAGLALGAAINVKLIPVLLIPVALSFCRSRRDVLRLLAGVLLCALPFVPLLVRVPNDIRQNMLSYVSRPDRWGVLLFLYDLAASPRYGNAAMRMMQSYFTIGRILIIAAALGIGLLSFRRRSWNTYQAFTLVFAAFLILAPGFSVQYLIMVVPLLLATSLPRAWIYSAFCGVFLALAYGMTLVGGIPFISMFPVDGIPMPAPLFGFGGWLLLIEFSIRMLLLPLKTTRINLGDD